MSLSKSVAVCDELDKKQVTEHYRSFYDLANPMWEQHNIEKKTAGKK